MERELQHRCTRWASGPLCSDPALPLHQGRGGFRGDELLNSQLSTKMPSTAEPLLSSRQFLCYSAAGGWVAPRAAHFLNEQLCPLPVVKNNHNSPSNLGPASFIHCSLAAWQPSTCLQASGRGLRERRLDVKRGVGPRLWPWPCPQQTRPCLLASSLTLYLPLPSPPVATSTSFLFLWDTKLTRTPGPSGQLSPLPTLSRFWQDWFRLVTQGSR